MEVRRLVEVAQQALTLAPRSPNAPTPPTILNWLFTGGPEPGCLKAADSNDSGDIDLSDPVYLLGYLFVGGPEMSTPLEECGHDLTPDTLTCDEFPPCP